MNLLMKKLFKEFGTLEVSLLENETPQYTFSGFYKYGSVNIVEDGEKLICSTRYDIVKTVSSWEELVVWNYDVWDSYQDSFLGWKSPEEPFYSELVKMGLYLNESEVK